MPKSGVSARELMTVIRISKVDGGLKGVFYSIDEPAAEPVAAPVIRQDGLAVRMSFPGMTAE